MICTVDTKELWKPLTVAVLMPGGSPVIVIGAHRRSDLAVTLYSIEVEGQVIIDNDPDGGELIVEARAVLTSTSPSSFTVGIDMDILMEWFELKGVLHKLEAIQEIEDNSPLW